MYTAQHIKLSLTDYAFSLYVVFILDFTSTVSDVLIRYVFSKVRSSCETMKYYCSVFNTTYRQLLQQY